MWWHKKRRPAIERPVVEALEPRILYAADLAAGLMLADAGDLTDAGDVSDVSVEWRALDAAFDYLPLAAAQESATPATSAAAPTADTAAQALQRSRLALNFETNVGQADAGIDFIAHGSGVGIALADGNATLTLRDGERSNLLRMRLAGATGQPSVQAEGEVTSRTNYLIGNSGDWLQNVENHAAVRYAGVYDGIDLRYYGRDQQLEYDFIVAAGADWRAIALDFEGADRVAVDADGALRLTLGDTGNGVRSIRFEAPVSYQAGANGREAVASQYVVGGDGRVRFDIGAYDAGRALVIDPVLAYGTYFGSAAPQDVRAVGVGSDGAVYLAGSDNADAVVVKLSPTLGTVVYTTYIGAALGPEGANGIAVDAAGQAYVAGTTSSLLFYGNTVSGSDAFVAKLSADGSSLLYTKTLSTGLADEGKGIAVDTAGQAYLVANTGNFGSTDVTVAKLNAAGSAFLYQYSIAGNGADSGDAIAVDASGRAAITGQTASTNLGAYLVNAFDTSLAAGNDAFVFQFNAAGTAVTYGTLFGGNASDAGHAIAYGPGGNIYIAGETGSANLDTTSGALQTSYVQNSEAFAALFNPALSGSATRVYASYLSGDGNDYGRAIAVDAAGLVYVAGSTTSTAASSFPISADAAQPTPGGQLDAFLTILNPAGGGNADLIYSSYLGGSGNDDAYALALGSNQVVLAGTTTSSTGIARSGGADTSFGGIVDGFAVSFNLAATLVVDTANDVADGTTTSIAALLAARGADGKISLREAIAAANNTANRAGGPDRIVFAIGGGGLQTINLGTALPDISDAVVIDATSQGGFAGAPLIELNGSAAGGSAFGLSITSGNSTVRGLIINQFKNGGISLTAGGGNLIAGNYIGTDATGNLDAGNSKDGIYIASANNIIGGITAAERNVISGNGWSGIDLWGASATGNLIYGNYIGLNAAGTAALGNDDNGIVSGSNASGHIIGGSAAGAGNLIAGHNLTANSDGIRITGGSGGSIAGNRIGTDAGGTLALANSRNGILLSGAQNYTIGGAAAAAANIIANSGAAGVVIAGSGSGNRVQGNAIYANGGLGIDLDNNGVTGNDGAQAALTPNLLTDAPVFTSATLGSGTLTLTGYVGSAAGQALFAGSRVEVFLAASDPSGFGEGQTSLGTLTADGSGNFSGSLALTGVSVGSTLTATATDGAGNTSEFGANRLVSSANTAPVISSNGGGASAALSVAENSSAVTTVTATDADLPAPTLTYSISGGADAGRFTINPSSGVLSFIAAPNYEAPTDAGANNVYDLTVQVSDGTFTDTQAISVTVTNINEAPVVQGDAYAVANNAVLTVAVASGLLANDSDPENDVLSVLTVSAPSRGTLSLTPGALTLFSNLTNNAAADTRADWSPDGAKIAFDTSRDGNNEIYVMNADGSGLLRLTSNAADDSQAAWSPDGSKIAFMSNRDGNYEVWVMNASNGAGLVQLTSTTSAVSGQPAWSPDGSRIAFTSNQSAGNYELWVINANGSGATRLTSATGDDAEPAWSPDGTTIAFSATRDGNSEIYVMNANGSGQTRLTSNAAIDRAPVWSQDGSKLAFASDRNGTSQIFIMDAAGTNQTAVTAAASAISFPDWSADGLKLLFTYNNEVQTANAVFDGAFVYTPTAGYVGADSFTYTVTDRNGHTATATATITVNASNVAPVIRSNGGGATAAISVAENATMVTTVAATDADLPAQTLTYAITGGADAAKFTINPGSGVLGFSAAPNFEAPGDVGTNNIYDVTVQASDGTLTDTQAISVTVTNVNDAPAGANASVATNEDTVFTFSAANFGFSDAGDSPANALLAVKIATLPGAGTLTNNGAAVSAGQTITVTDINLGRLLFTPVANANGSGYASFTFQVQDNGGTANGGIDLDASPNTLTVNLSAVNDAPVLAGANNLNAINEDAASNNGTLVSALIAGMIFEADAGAASGIAVTAMNNTNGTWQYTTNGGTAWAAFGAPTATTARLLAADANTSVRLVPNANWNGTFAGGITFRAWDQTAGLAGATASTSTNGGTSAYSTATASAGITVNPVNDAPAGNNNTVTTSEDTAYAFAAADFGFTDASDSPANMLSAVKIATLPGAGTLTNNGAAVSAGQSITVADINLGRLAFTPGSNANGSGYASFTFQVQDDGGTANGGIDLAASANTLTVNVSAVNDAPAGTDTTVTTSEDAAYTFSAANFGFTDTSDSPANTLLTVKVATLPAAGALTNNGAAVSAGQTITLADINLGRLLFTAVANANGTAYASFTFQVQDNGGTANGGIDLDASPNIITVNLTAVNDAPVLAGANNLNAINEDLASASNNGTLVSALIAGMVTEVDSAAASGIAVTAVVNSNGTWQYTADGGGTWTAFGAPTAGTARLLAADANTSVRLVPNANWNGTVAGGITFRAWDQTAGLAGSTASTGSNGGSNAYSTATASAGITVDAVNDAPAGTSKTVTTSEDTAYTFAAADFGFTDPNDTPANTLGAVRISTLPGAGTLTNNGVAVSAGQAVVVADINAGKLRFNPVANANGTGYASFTFQVRDNGGTANGGVNLDASPNTMTVNVTAIDDAPVNTVPAAQATAYNTALVFSSANGNRISVADVDAAAATVQITLTATNGALALSGVAGLTFTDGANGSASMAFTGTLASINTALNGLTFTPSTNFSGSAMISLLCDDLGNSGAGGPQSDSDTVAVTVNTSTALYIVSDAFAAAEDAILNAASVLGNDSDPALGVMSVVAVNGNGAAVGSTITLGSGAQLSMRADGTFTYNPNGAFESLAQGDSVTDSFTYTVSSTSGGSGVGTAVMTIAGANDAPVLGGVNDLNAIDEDEVGDGGTLVSALIAGKVTDVDNAAAIGIAVVAVDNTNGTWQYSINGGATWAAFGAPANNNARLLAADADTSVRFQPNANWNGTVAGGIRVIAWDRTSGVAGGTADTAANGGSSAFSSGTVGAGITVGAVNDAPEGTNKMVTINEDTAHTFAAADFGFTDISDSPANALVAVRIATAPGAGTLSNNGTAVSAGQIITAADINLGRLLFTPGANANGAGYASFTFQVQDDGGTANGGIDLDASSNTITLGVTAVNDAPAGANTTVITSEDTAYTFSAANFGFTDIVDTPANALLAVTVTGLPGAGALTNNGAAVSVGQSITLTDINLGRLLFTPIANANGTGYASFSFQVQDDGGTVNGGVDLDASANTLTVDVNAVNDAPLLAGANNLNPISEDLAVAANNGTLVSALIAGMVTEADSAAAAGIAVTAVVNTNGTWQYTTNGGAVWTAFGTPTAGTARLLAADANTSVRLVPNANWSGAVAGGITFRAWDQTSGSAGSTASTSTNGGTSAYSTATASAGITVSAVNDAPSGTNTTVTTNEDTAHTFAAADFGFTDASDSPANALLAVKIATLPVSGTLTNNGAAVSAGQTITAADINLGRLLFAPGSNANGTAYAGFTFQVQDNGGTTNGGIDLDASARTLTIDVIAVNDAPAGSSATVTTREDRPYIFSTADFGFSDAGDSPANAQGAVRLSTLPIAGILTLNGAAVSAGQTVTAADISLGRLLFTPAANASGASYASLSFQVQDDGGIANGGVDLDATPATLTIDVSALNDAPVGADRSITLLEDSGHTFSATDFAFADTADSPANAWLAVRIATLPGAGALTLNSAAVVNGQSISAAEIAAGRLLYRPAPDGNGVSYAGFSFQVQDDGGTAGGGVDLDLLPRRISFDVTAINDAPSGSDRSIAVTAGNTYAFGVADFGATDAGDRPADPLAAVTIDSLPATGALRLAGSAVTAGQSVSAADIAAARLTFTLANTGTVSFAFRVQDSGGTANGGIDSETAAHTVQISVVTPVAITTNIALISDGTPPTTIAVTPAPAVAAPVTAVAPVAVATPQAASTAPARSVSPATAATLTDDGAGVATGSSSVADSTPPGARARDVRGIEAAATALTELRALGALSGERKGFAFESVTMVDAILAAGTRTEVSRSSFEQFLTSLRAQGFIDQLDRVRDDAKHEFDLDKSFAVTATGVSFGLSVAYVLWLVRSGVLIGSLLSSLPAWRVLDPLPVLAREGDADEDETDDEVPDQTPRETDHALQTLRGY